MAGGLDNLSAEGLGELANKLNEATKNLQKALKQQEKLLKTALETEEKIISTRVAGLKGYNDAYSNALNSVKSEIATLNADMFKINENSKATANNAKKTASNSNEDNGSKASKVKQVYGKPASISNRSVNQTVSNEAKAQMGDADSANYKNFAQKLKAEKDAIISKDALNAELYAKNEARTRNLEKLEKAAYEAVLNAALAKEEALGNSDDAKKARLIAIRELELSNIAEVANAEKQAYELKNEMLAQLAYNNGVTDESGGTNNEAKLAAAEANLKKIKAIEDAKALHELQKQMDAERAEAIYQRQLANDGELHAADLAAIDQAMAEKYGSEKALQEQIAAIQKKQFEEKKKAREEEEKALKKQKKEEAREKRDKRPGQEYESKIAGATKLGGLSKEDNLVSRLNTLGDVVNDKADAGMNKALAVADVVASALSSIVKQLENQADQIAAIKGKVDTRLQGSSNETSSGSYWNRILKDVTAVGAVNPYFKQEDFTKNIQELVNQGIAFDLEQRAFLMTIQEKIATTFKVADGTLLRLVRIQQEDSTAGRLGMEASLNAFLNNMYETTEYLSDVAAGVRSSLEEMESLMSGAEAAEVEYQVQKWLGSLYSVGMSKGAIDSIAQAIGQIGAGQIEGLTNSNAGNLLIMAAGEAGLSITDLLTNGLDASDTNKLLQAAVNYLAELANSSKDNQVVQQQLATVFGVKASDLKAATNLATKDSVSAVYGQSMSYGSMLDTLFAMAGTMGKRTSTGEAISNIWNNTLYTLAGSIASSPVSYGLLKMGDLLDKATGGGIDLPFINVMGFGVDLNTSIADLMRVGALSTGILGSIGSLMQGLGNSFDGQKMLEQVGVKRGSGLAVTPRGEGGGIGALEGGGSSSTSGSGYVGNSNASDIKNTTMQEAEDSKKQLMVEAKEEEESNKVDVLNNTVIKIYELLDDVAHGSSCFRVKVDNYGLTKAGGSGSLGGVNALNSSSSGTDSLDDGSGMNGEDSSPSGGTKLSFGGWTTSF